MMTVNDALSWLRSGDITENIMAQITHDGVANDPVSPPDCFISSSTPMLCQNLGVLKIAQFDTGSGTERYRGLISRVTGLGDSYSGLLSGGAGGFAGSLEIVLDGSSVAKEIVSLNWQNKRLELRTGPVGTKWGDGFVIHKGTVVDAERSTSGETFSFRVTGLEPLMNERFYWQYSQGLAENGVKEGRAPIGWCAKYLVKFNKQVMKAGDPKLYDTAISSVWQENDYWLWSYRNGEWVSFWNETINPSLVLETGHTLLKSEYAYNLSDQWERTEKIPTKPVGEMRVSLLGFDTEDSGATVDLGFPGSILQAALDTLTTKGTVTDDELEAPMVGSGGAPLSDITIDTGSLIAYDLEVPFTNGYLFDTHPGRVERSEDTGLQIFADHDYDAARWRSAFDHLIAGTAGIWCFDRDGVLAVHSMLSAPTSASEVVIQQADYESQSYEKVFSPDKVTCRTAYDMPNAAGQEVTVGDEDSISGNEINYDCTLTPMLFITNVGTPSVEMEDFATKILNRFGERDYTFTNCLIAKTLSVGEVVTIDIDDDQGFFSTPRTGWVIGVERGSEPSLSVRL